MARSITNFAHHFTVADIFTGKLTWPFGPKSDQCREHSKCWQGILTCGNFSRNRLVTEVSKYIHPESTKLAKSSISPADILKLQYISSYSRTWSMRGLHVHVRILGAELIAPTMRLVKVKRIGHENVDEVIIANFVPTISGKYSVDMRLVGFYPGTC